MPEAYRIRIDQPRLVISAAHFITFGEDVCERIHGHNYHVWAEIDGPLDENHLVADFLDVRDALQRIVNALDHRVLLPTEHPTIHVAEQVGDSGVAEVIALHGKRRWVFPREDCALLPLANTTAELLARHIALELREALVEITHEPPSRVAVGVDECDGQWGVYEFSGDP